MHLILNREKKKWYLPPSFNAIEILPKGTPKNPELGEAELIGTLDLWLPHIYGCLCSIVLVSLYISNCMLHSKNKNTHQNQNKKQQAKALQCQTKAGSFIIRT